MVTDVLDYIEAYDNIRAVCGLNTQELPDATLALAVYRNELSLALLGIEGIYTPSTAAETLETIFDRLADTDEMYVVIQQYSIYTVADAVLDSIGLRAYKTITDGKSNITRFSPESTYLGTRRSIKDNLNQLLASIYGLLDSAAEQSEYLTVVTPDVDLVVGE